jgi:hypothetical protein
MASKRSTKAKAKARKPTKIATKKSKTKSKAAPAKRRLLSRAEVERRLEIARGAATKRRTDRSGLQQRLASALEVAQQAASDAGYQSVLKIAFPPRTFETAWRAPWVIVGRFVWRGKPIGYQDLHKILDRWAKTKVTRRIDELRVARLRVIYLTDDGKREEYTLAETAPWGLTIARAKQECDPTDTLTAHPGGARGSLAARYGIRRDARGRVVGGTQIESVYVWLSEQIGFNRMKLKK